MKAWDSLSPNRGWISADWSVSCQLLPSCLLCLGCCPWCWMWNIPLRKNNCMELSWMLISCVGTVKHSDTMEKKDTDNKQTWLTPKLLMSLCDRRRKEDGDIKMETYGAHVYIKEMSGFCYAVCWQAHTSSCLTEGLSAVSKCWFYFVNN